MRIRCESKKTKKSEADIIRVPKEKFRGEYPRATRVKVELDKEGDDKAILTYPNPSSAEKALENMPLPYSWKGLKP